MKAAEEKRPDRRLNSGQKTQLIHRKLKLLITTKYQSQMEVALGIKIIKATWEIPFLKMERNVVKRFILLSNHFFGKS